MRPTTFLSIVLTAALLGCASPSGPPADRIVYRTSETPAPRLDEHAASTAKHQPAPRVPAMNDMTEGERVAWFQSQGIYPYPWVPSPTDQTLGYVAIPTDTSWILPTVLAAGAIYGLYRVKRHNDW